MSKETKHTPGPITFEGWFPPREPGLLPSVKAAWDGRMIQLFSQDLEQAEIDLKFLASAPELLDALESLVIQLGAQPTGSTLADYCFNARQAIAKARGER